MVKTSPVPVCFALDRPQLSWPFDWLTFHTCLSLIRQVPNGEVSHTGIAGRARELIARGGGGHETCDVLKQIMMIIALVH